MIEDLTIFEVLQARISQRFVRITGMYQVQLTALLRLWIEKGKERKAF